MATYRLSVEKKRKLKPALLTLLVSFPCGFGLVLCAPSTAPCPSALGRRLKRGEFRGLDKIAINSQKRFQLRIILGHIHLCQDTEALVQVYTGTLLSVPSSL